ncbi:hypothetical protein [Aestuariirhabdus litorea]|uniref:Capsule biosynthesis GfcC-like C-terminal domain-containing protein n=1 Tax=Aestuariirhabdus litorea TaxID=2528527 RepID=A0A3P3VMZ9_9GAMM|nr:hypothetical protein [Aestuariirhabdus litorea]RRJ84065.1 hypothetical protein D0544_02795 [Aestuariirhabdus litorea]RWW97285.1 hypothetical protein DZC74_02790 [Endozoicomonadaceae bacterium GTF-13]
MSHRCAARGRLYPLLAAALLLSACATGPTLPPPKLSHCGEALGQLQRQAIEAGRADQQERALPGYPYLRADRTLWSLLGELDSAPKRQQWLQLSAQLGAQALRSDHANLGSASDLGALLGCLPQQSAQLEQVPDWPQALASHPYPSSYRRELQVLGLYPLSKQLIRLPLAPLHRQLSHRFEQGPQPPTEDYRPAAAARPDPARVTRWLEEAYRTSPLGLPTLSEQQQQQLLAQFAPLWQIEQRGPFDRPGRPFWKGGQAAIDTASPTTYSRLGYSRWQGRWLLQLSYLVWFSERPPSGWLDIYAGRLDGLYLRITLDSRGRPLLLDSIHPCGCYYSLIPLQPGLQLRPAGELGEPPLLLPTRPVEMGKRLRISISSGDHMLVGADWVDPDRPGTPYRRQSDDVLRRLADGAQRRSLYVPPYGLIPGTRRGEQVLLWPSGITAPGALRQWGQHAIAFSSERHFDDPDLLMQLFR